MAVARSFSGGVAICYVLPVLRMTPYLHVWPGAYRGSMEMTLWTIVVYIQSDSPGGGTDPGTESDIYDCLINTVCLVCGARYMQRSGVRPSVCPSVRLSVCLSHRSTAAVACCGFAAGLPAGRRYRSTAAARRRSCKCHVYSRRCMLNADLFLRCRFNCHANIAGQAQR